MEPNRTEPNGMAENPAKLVEKWVKFHFGIMLKCCANYMANKRETFYLIVIKIAN